VYRSTPTLSLLRRLGPAEPGATSSCRFRSQTRRAVVFQHFASLKALENQPLIGLKRA